MLAHTGKTVIRFALTALLIASAAHVSAADDTARFDGTWLGSFPYNGQVITMVSVHDASGYRNSVNGVPAGAGTFSAANGRYATSADAPNDTGTYRFVNENEVVCTNAAGQTVTWRRQKAASPSAPRAPDGNAGTGPASVGGGTYAPDPSLSPGTNAAIAAFNRKDYTTAWRGFMAEARNGDSEAQAGVGAMLLKHLNPPGTGIYADCEKWLVASANQGNVKGMTYLGQYHYERGVAIAGGINPGINTSPIPPALRKQADDHFAVARSWFDRAAAAGDPYAAGNLAIMLDAGVGGPRDTARAAQLREQVKRGADPNFVRRATADPGSLAASATWQAGHYEEAVRNAQAAAANGDVHAEALLGRAYYQGLGVPRNYATALVWLNKAAAKGDADSIFFLGLMYEWGRGVPQDVPRAQKLFDKAAALGQPYARMEAKGMRMEGAAAEQQARFAAQCQSRGGIADGPVCERYGFAIDPY